MTTILRSRFAPGRSLAALILVVALAAHGFIPVGYMPDLSAGPAHHAGLVICGGHASHKNDKTPEQGGPHGFCPFAAAAFFTGAVAPVLVARPPEFVFAYIVPAGFRLAHVFTFGNAPPRGPPVLS